MSLSLPLSIRLKTTRKDMDVTDQTDRLRFSSTVPGGFAACEIGLSRPLDIQPDEIEYFGTLFVYDSRNGRTVWEGRLEDPGRSAGDGGEVWQITAVGPSAHAKDRNTPLIYVDTSLDRWVRSNLSTGGASTQTAEIDADTPSLQVRASEGASVPLTWQGEFVYRYIQYCGMKIARLRFSWIAEQTNSNYHTGAWLRVDSAASTFALTHTWDIVEDVIAVAVGSSGWDINANVAGIRADRSTTAVTANAITGMQAYNVVIRSMLKDVNGNDITDPSEYSGDNYVSSVEVVKDLLGRLLNKFDGPNATVIGSGVDIEQIAYPDGVTPSDVLDDLAVFEPAFYWAAWESSDTGLNRFEYKPWPTTVRYEADTTDGGDFPGSASELFNRVTVRWLDVHKKIRNTVRTQVVPQLDDAGLVRQDFIDISDEIGSKNNSIIVGDNFLAEHRYPPNAGTLTVSRPIVDNVTGRMVMPWEILPGNLIRVAGVLPRVDSLNPTNRDGVTIFRIVTHSFDESSGSATLELDSYSRTVARALARLGTKHVRKR